MPNLSMVFDVLAIDRASEVFHRIGNAAGESGAKVEAASTGINNAGSKLAAGVGIAAAAVAVASIKMAGDFQASTTRLVTSANETQGNLEMVRKGLLDMAGQVGYSVEDLSKAMYKVESGGQHGAKGLEVLKAAAQGAKTENADLTTVADAVTSALADYGTKAGSAADITSKLVAATASGKMTFQELAGSMAAILPTASANHIAFNDILGDLASMTVHGMSAEQAAQNMADAVRHLTGSTQLSTKELSLIGMTAQQVSRDLSAKGLSGTVQELSQAVLKHLGPGTSEVVLNLGAALNGLNPAVRDLGMKLMDGTISAADYVKAAKALAPELQGQAQQFATLAKATHGIGNEQMTGSQVMTSYSAAMKALMGDATGMNVALMLTGDNSKTTATAIENVTKATADASGNVRGWDLIQGNFNQKLDQAKGHVQAMAIEFGMHLLPALTSAMDFVNSTVLPGIEHLGSGVASAAKWWAELPAPIKDFTLALTAMRLADHIGLLDKLSASVGRFREEMALQQALYRAQSSGLSEFDRVMGGVAASSGAAEGGLSRFGAVASTVASRSMGALKASASGLLGMFGGPWGIALAGAATGVSLLVDWLNKGNATTANMTESQGRLKDAISATNGALDESVRRAAAKELQDQHLLAFAKVYGATSQDLVGYVLGEAGAHDRVTAAMDRYRAGLQAKLTGDKAADAMTQGLIDAFDGQRKALDGLASSTDSQVGKEKEITAAMGVTSAAVGALADQVRKMGLTITATWDENTQVLAGATAQQIGDLKSLGQTVMTLPNGQVVVTSDTGPARAQMQALVDSYKNYTININPQGMALTTEQRNALYSGKAAGGPIHGPGTGTSDTAGLFALSNGEHVWTAAETQAAGGHAAVESLRKAVLSSGRGLAGGGAVVTESARFSDAYIAAAQALIARMGQMGQANAAAASFSGSGVSGGNAANRALGQQIAASMGLGSQFPAVDYVFSHESGWNNLAKNPTSTAYGIAQFLDSTWATVGGHKTSDPSLQIEYGLKYMNKYGGPNGAASFWAGHHWYGDGTNYVPTDQLAVLHKGEAVIPAAKNQGAPWQTPSTQVRVFIGERELTDIVRVEMDASDHALANDVHYGRG